MDRFQRPWRNGPSHAGPRWRSSDPADRESPLFHPQQSPLGTHARVAIPDAAGTSPKGNKSRWSPNFQRSPKSIPTAVSNICAVLRGAFHCAGGAAHGAILQPERPQFWRVIAHLRVRRRLPSPWRPTGRIVGHKRVYRYLPLHRSVPGYSNAAKSRSVHFRPYGLS